MGTMLIFVESTGTIRITAASEVKWSLKMTRKINVLAFFPPLLFDGPIVCSQSGLMSSCVEAGNVHRASAATSATGEFCIAEIRKRKEKEKESDRDELLNKCRFILAHHLFAKHPLYNYWWLTWLINLLGRHRINYRHIISNWCSV